MDLTLTTATARLSELVRTGLQGAELIEFRAKDESTDENRYIVRWTKNTAAAGEFREYGTHVACLHVDGRSMLVWGHYTRNEGEAKRDYRKRT
jgi:hypothetical protein